VQAERGRQRQREAGFLSPSMVRRLLGSSDEKVYTLHPPPESRKSGLETRHAHPSSSSLLLSSLELSDTKVYEPQIRALLGTALHFCEVIVLKLRTAPIGTAHPLPAPEASGLTASPYTRKVDTCVYYPETRNPKSATRNPLHSYLRLIDFCITQLQACE